MMQVRVMHFLESAMVWRKKKRGRSPLPVEIEVSLRMVEWLMRHELVLVLDHELLVGVLEARAWVLRCSS